MAANDELWGAVVAAYPAQALVELTNINDRSANGINTSVGNAAAQSVINLWPAYAQVAYDLTSQLHVEVGMVGVIAILWRRGGVSSALEQVKWDEVFGDNGLIQKLRRTGPRGRSSPKISGALTASSQSTSDGQNIRPWSDKDSLPVGFLPLNKTAD